MNKIDINETEGIKEHNAEKKRWLLRYWDAKREYARLTEELEELRAMQLGAKAITYSDMPKGGGIPADLSDYAARLDALERKILSARYRQANVFGEIKDAIDALPTAKERQIMSYRYLMGHNWEKVCEKVNLSWSVVTQDIHGRALKNIKIPKKN